MIPWRLKFSGVRDYTPTVMDFSQKDEHILISGPNGAGKSTVTFCMGGVLYSSKVDLEGLKSNNLPQDKTWRAKIELLFKNDGKVKVDAPQFVQFRIDVEQKPGDPVKREFYIQEGESIDEWERETKYSSGDRNFNFTEYKNQLLYKYAIDPDELYLIWYQKEVNQFAVMHPEERFRIFSEMNGIDKIQKNWEESKELVKETQQTLQVAESKQRLNKLQLDHKKGELERYHSRNQRLEDGFKQYITALKWLERYYLDQMDALRKQSETLRADKEEKISGKQQDILLQAEKKEELEQYQDAISRMENREVELGEELDNLQSAIKENQDKKDAISKEIEEITNQVERIGMTEEEVNAALLSAEQTHTSVCASMEEKQQKVESNNRKIDELIPNIAELKVMIDQDSEKEQEVRKLIDAYQSSQVVQREMEVNEKRLEDAKDEKGKLVIKKENLAKELDNLRNNRVLNPRQETAIQYFNKQNIEVYPLRELLALDDAAKANDEDLFDTIKYTMFVNKHTFQAPNDLYYVPLQSIVPEKTISHLASQHIKIKENLSDKLYPFAVKALWWVKSFFEEEKPMIQNGFLIDARGIRGPQEEKKIILSEKVLKNNQILVEKDLEKVVEAISNLTNEIAELSRRNSTLFRRHESLKDAEAFIIKENEREWRKNKYDNLSNEKRMLEDERDKFQSEWTQLNEKRADWKHKVERYTQYQETFIQFAKEKEKIIEVTQLKQYITELEAEEKSKNTQYDELINHLDSKRREEKKLKRDLEDIGEKIVYKDRDIEQIERQIKNRSEEYLTNEENYSTNKRESHRLIDSVKKELKDFALALTELPSVTRSDAEEMRESGKIQYNHAVNEKDIDEAAPENYRKMKEEYDRSANEVKKSKILLEDYTERMEQLKEDLENTINTKVIGVNQKFVNYMSLFGFQGQIDWDMRTDRHNQIHYALYIKARKEGHRGKLEDVSVKARGGKVGKGVSGGEESLSSLLFALALLQTIQASPGYIVLDEFDSALDEGRKDKVFELYEQELNRKMIILTPKSHESEYLYRFSKAYVVHHNPNIPQSKIFKVRRSK
ncbi:AAA family ATPase [Aquibacillus koreensis]|uniref:AAA family ATPase n=1 Tax=Aquibacillus koreensis TaxID=279446 RepID=A0A9X3WGU1_9BACI|nr:AAA family ATPase [Aquibacillus koreensis]MCT2534753.1 AAA family ATPase [Aquibacillus koreensis]MDC3419637.1 AAA family ATPase [Aquibacillus koreensis]